MSATTKAPGLRRLFTRLRIYRDAPEAREARATGKHIVRAFMREALPEASEATRKMAGDLIKTTLSTVGKHFSESVRTSAEIDAYAEAMGDMFCAYLKSLRTRPRRSHGE